jgi:hypothetical protein
MLSDILAFIWAVLSHWQSYATGGVVTGLIGVVERLSGKQLPKKLYLSIFVVSFLLAAFFMAWRDEYSRANQLSFTGGSQRQRIEDLSQEKQNCQDDYTRLKQNLPVDFVEPKDSLRRKTLRIVKELMEFWSTRPLPAQPVPNATSDEDRKRNAVWDQYWREAQTAYGSANFRNRLLGIVREYKNKGIETGFLERSLEQPERLIGSFPYGGWQLDNCFQFESEICLLHEMAYHVDAHDQAILLTADSKN